MANELGNIIADFQTSLATKINIGGETAKLTSAIDADGAALPAGRYFFTIDGDSNIKEHISCMLDGVEMTDIKTIARGTGQETAGVLREHRVGASVTITDFAHIKKINNLLDGTTGLNADKPLKYDDDPILTDSKELATKKYVDERRYFGTTSTAILKPNLEFYNQFIITAQEEDLEIANPVGTASEGQAIILKINDNGTERLLTWGTDYVEVGTTLPNVTIAGKTMYIGGIWNGETNKIDILSVNT